MRACRSLGTGLLLTGLAACGGSGSSQRPQSIPVAPAVAAPAMSTAPTLQPVPIAAPQPSVSATSEFRQNAAAYAQIGLPAAHDAGWSGRGVTVGVLDDGIDNAAGEFAGRLSPLTRDFGHDEQLVGGSYAAVTRVGLAGPYTDHGVKVAAILGAARDGRGIVGVAPDVMIAVLRTDVSRPGNGTEYFPDDTVAAAISYAAEVGLRLLNVSLSRAGRSEPIIAAANRFALTGGLIVFAAGNSGSPDPDIVANITDANRSNILLVGGLATTGDRLDPRSSRAGVLADRFIVAPMDVITLTPDGTPIAASGTSFAAPMVTGAAALLLQKWPQLSGAQAGEILLTTARDLGAPGTDAVFGRGLLDVAAAIAPVDPMLATAQKGASLAGATLALPKAFGPTALRSVLDTAVVTDRWGRDFQVALGSRVSAASGLVSLRSMVGGLRGTGFATSGFSGHFSFRNDRGESRLATAMISGRIGRRNLSLALGPDPWGVGVASVPLAGPSGLSAYVPSASLHLRALSDDGDFAVQISQGASPAGSATAATMAWMSGPLAISAVAVAERGTLFGQAGGGGLQLASTARTLAVEVARAWALSGRWTLGVRAAAGVTRVAVPQGSLFRAVGPLASSQFAAELHRAVGDGDLRLSIAQPLRVEHGVVTVMIPDRYDLATRAVVSTLHQVSVASEHRAFQVGTSYDQLLGKRGAARLSVTHALGSGESAALGSLSVGF